MRRISVGLVWILLAVHLPAEESLRWTNSAGKWCLLHDKSRKCLPSEFEVFYFSDVSAAFELANPGDAPNIFVVVFYLNNSFMGERLDMGDAFIPQESETIESFLLTEYVVNPEKMPNSDVDIFVIERPGLFALSIIASKSRSIGDLARVLARSWSEGKGSGEGESKN